MTQYRSITKFNLQMLQNIQTYTLLYFIPVVIEMGPNSDTV